MARISGFKYTAEVYVDALKIGVLDFNPFAADFVFYSNASLASLLLHSGVKLDLVDIPSGKRIKGKNQN